MIKKITRIYDDDGSINMGDMQPYDIGVIVKAQNSEHRLGRIVMRTASENSFEVMDLSKPQFGGCWTSDCDLSYRVRLFPPGHQVILEVAE